MWCGYAALAAGLASHKSGLTRPSRDSQCPLTLVRLEFGPGILVRVSSRSVAFNERENRKANRL